MFANRFQQVVSNAKMKLLKHLIQEQNLHSKRRISLNDSIQMKAFSFISLGWEMLLFYSH